MTRVANSQGIVGYNAVVVRVGDPSVKLMSEACMIELEAMQSLFKNPSLHHVKDL